MNRKYDVIELQKMETIDLISLAETNQIQIQNNFKQGLIRAILSRQAESQDKPSELNSRHRYAVAESITQNTTP